MTVNLDSPRTIGSLVFDNPSNSFNWSILGSNPLTLSTSAAGGPSIAVNNGIMATIATPLVGAQGFTKTGTGTFDFSGSGVTVSGGVTLNAGGLVLDYASTNNTASKLGTGPLTLNGGALSLTANSGLPVTQTVPGNTFLNSGQTYINATGTGSVTLAAGNIVRSAGATVDITPNTGLLAFNVATSLGSTNSMLGSGPAFATVGGGKTWATTSGGAIDGFSGYGTNVFILGMNVDVTASSAPAGFIANSLRFNTGGVALTLGGANALQSGGILVTPSSGGATIAGGTLAASNSGEIIVHQYSLNPMIINSTLVSVVGLTKSGPGMLKLGAANLLSGPIVVNGGELFAGSPLAFGNNPSITVAAGATLNIGGNNLALSSLAGAGSVNNVVTNTPAVLTVGANNVSSTFAGMIADASSGAMSLVKTGSGTFTFSGTVVNRYGGVTLGSVTLNGGAFVLDYASTNNTASKLGTGPLTLNGGVVSLTANPGTPVTQTVSGNTFVNSGDTYVTSTGMGTVTLAIGNIVRSPGGGTIDFAPVAGPLTFNITTPMGSTNGLLGTGAPFATVGGGDTWATTSGGTIAGFSNYVADGYTPGTNVDVTASVAPTGFIANSLRLNTGGLTLTLGGANSLQSGGILVTPSSSGATIVGGTLAASDSGELIVHQYGAGPLTISSTVVSSSGLTKAGPGTLLLTSWNTYTGPTVVSSGSLIAGSPSAFGHNSAITVLAGGTLSINGNNITVGSLAGTGTVVNNSPTAATLTVGASNASTTFAGLLADGSTGALSLVKAGSGTLTLTGTSTYSGGTTVANGTLAVSSNTALGTGPVTVSVGATLSYVANVSTINAFNLGGSTLAVGSGASVTLIGSTVTGGYLGGPGTFSTNAAAGSAFANATSLPDAKIISNSPADRFLNFTNGGALTVAAGVNTAGTSSTVNLNGFTNEGSGSITIGAASKISVANFESYGTLTINPAVVGSGQKTLLTNIGGAPLGFNGGSRTFLGTPATALYPGNWPVVALRGTPTFVAGIDLHGQNLVVAGGLFANNGFVVDTTNGGTGTATIIVDFGALVRGAGYYQNTVITRNGGRFQPSSGAPPSPFGSPGAASFGSLVLGPGGIQNYSWQINDAIGTAGPGGATGTLVRGWSQLQAIIVNNPFNSTMSTGDLTWTATSATGNQFNFALQTLLAPSPIGGPATQGLMANFNFHQSYIWPVITYRGTYSGPTDAGTLTADTLIDLNNFANPHLGTFSMQLVQAPAGGGEIDLVYAIPEPGTLTLVATAAGGWLTLRRRQFRNPV
jgi:autotransporter-associated beta strand protein